MGTTEVSLDRQLDEDDEVHCTMGSYSALRKVKTLLAVTWMGLENTMLSDISQTENLRAM